MTVRYFVVWTLKRGKVSPPEAVNDHDQERIEASVRQESKNIPVERDEFWEVKN